MVVLESESPINYELKIFLGVMIGIIYNIDYLVITTALSHAGHGL